MRRLLVHERFTELAGSESVVLQFHRLWPEAPVLAPIVKSGVLPAGLDVATSPVQHLYRGGSYAPLLPLLPWAMRHLPLPPHDVVIASHHAFANRVSQATDKPVISYVHTPARWMWDADKRHGELGGRPGEMALAAFSAMERPADRRAAQQVHRLIANSRAVADRIATWWHRDSVVVHPPVNVDYFQPDPTVDREDFVLMAGRLVPYKRPDLAVRAAALAGLRLVVVGEGRAMPACRAAADGTTTFLGRVDNETLRDLYRRCAVLVMPGEEDFGIVPVEAQACGAPVVALGLGGALDSVVPGETGLLVEPSAAEDVLVTRFADALRDVVSAGLDSEAIRRHAEGFSEAEFRAQIQAVVDESFSGT
jgi:glycosyltransferase involved in cell wall biosynthesis